MDDTVLTLSSDQSSVVVHRDGFLIGSHPRCDLSLKDTTIQPLHSVIHMQSGAIWIESAIDDISIIVNDRACRRMALRQGDLIRIGASAFHVDLVANRSETNPSIAPQIVVQEDLAALSAEELCDRIVSEQSMIQELSHHEASGWEALIQAIEAVHKQPQSLNRPSDQTIPLGAEHANLSGLIGQIEELQQAIADRARELTEREAIVAASSSILEQSQQLVTQRLDVILEHLGKNDPPAELRASA